MIEHFGVLGITTERHELDMRRWLRERVWLAVCLALTGQHPLEVKG